MVFYTVAWSESQDSATLVNMAAVADPQLRTSGDDIIVPGFAPQLGAFYAVGAGITQAQFATPSTRRVFNLDLRPLDRAAEPSSPTPYVPFFQHPIPLVATEFANMLVAEDTLGADRNTGLAWLVDGPVAVDTRADFTVRATGSTTLTTFSWTNAALTFSQTLPAGNYDIVGARFESAGLIAARFVLVGASHRPGGIGYDAAGDVEHMGQRHGMWGIWGNFAHDAPPTVDFLSVSADTSETVYLDLVGPL